MKPAEGVIRTRPAMTPICSAVSACDGQIVSRDQKRLQRLKLPFTNVSTRDMVVKENQA
jgi:hypothetical protein